MRVSLVCLLLLVGCAGPNVVGPNPAPTKAQQASFAAYLKMLKIEAKAQGLNPSLLDDAFGPIPQPYGEAPAAQAVQPEFTNTFNAYVGKRLSPERIDKGQFLISQYRKELNDIEATTGVPGGIIVALWGLESNFGANQGGHPAIPSLATLSWQNEGRRTFFRKELFAALKVADVTGRNAKTLTGSWAGALGQSQFMPTNYLKLGRDGNGDGKVDLFGTIEDVHLSIATFLKQAGWQAGSPWKYESKLTQNALDEVADKAGLNQRGLSEPFTPAGWKSMGITPPAGIPATHKIRLYQPQGVGTPIFFTGPNFDVILDWNRSSYFAFTVLSLADIYQPANKVSTQ